MSIRRQALFHGRPLSLARTKRRLLAGLAVMACVCAGARADEKRSAYFVDGYHGGVYGHYPPGYTSFVVDQLRNHPEWKINLEIEPETWDVARASEPEAYEAFQEFVADQSDDGRVEIVNPTYAQSYLFQSSGESVIRQFDYGIRKTREHFPHARFTTYSSEEPCFTSCLPAVLTSFGFEFAVLKNPNTCWGGYTSPHGGELVNWIGPDGTAILSVPRYACEALHPTEPWHTTASGNAPEYVAACFDQGIAHPVGMCLQDAGWRGGPWLGGDHYEPSRYILWRDYIRNVTPARTDDDWRFTQEDVKPGLMWGAQVLQQIAQRSRAAEHRLLVAEKLSAMARIGAGRPARIGGLDEAWHGVLLSQHHDCWIVPYNGRPGNTWADQVRRWTSVSNAISDLAVETSLESLLQGEGGRGPRRLVRLFNPTGAAIDAVVPVPIAETNEPSTWISRDAAGRRFATQIVDSSVTGQSSLLVRAKLPALGYATVELRNEGEPDAAPVTAITRGETVVLESDLLRIEFNAAKGGTIRSLVAKSLNDREFVDANHERRFNELRGRFYEQGGFHSSAARPAMIRVTEDGPLRATVEISGSIADNPFTQRVSITQGSPVVDCAVRINWQGNPRIGEFEETDGWRNRRRPAYDDRFKLLALFPTNLANQRIVKNAPFDVCESKLDDSFYNNWENIKHNLILDWVDVEDGAGDYGLTLLSDHTTSYAHGANFPLGLTLQYAGKGLWARDYRVEGPTDVHYALVPHAGRWDAAGIPDLAANWSEPAIGAFARGGRVDSRSWIDPGDAGWQTPAMFERDGAIFVRLFNSHGHGGPRNLGIGLDAAKVELVELDGRIVERLEPVADKAGERTLRLAIPRFGIRTLRFSEFGPD